MPDEKLNKNTELLEMQKNWNNLEKETSNVRSNTRHVIRSSVQPVSFTGPITTPEYTVPERVEHSAEKFDPRDDAIAKPTTAYDRTLEKERKEEYDLEKKIPEDNNPSKPVEPPAKKKPVKGPGFSNLEKQLAEYDKKKSQSPN